MATEKLCPECTEITQEKCDPICIEEHNTLCIVHTEGLSCLGIEPGDETSLSTILQLLCGLNGGQLAVEVTEHPGNDACPNGGAIVSIGLDTDGDASTIETPLVTFNICNGADGADGASQMVSVAPIVGSPECPNGGFILTVDGVDYPVCNGVNGIDGGGDCDCPDVFEGVDFGCLQALGVDVDENYDTQTNMQGIINTLCQLLEGAGGATLFAADHAYEIEVGETLEINLLASGIIPAGETVTAVTISGLQSGDVDYNGEAVNVTTDGILQITGVSVGGDTRTYTITTDITGVSNVANLVITVVAAPEPLEFWDGVDPLCLTRVDQNNEIQFQLPINPAFTTISGTIRITTNDGACTNLGSGCEEFGTIDVIGAVFAGGIMLYSSGTVGMFSGDIKNGSFTVSVPTTTTCASCAPPKVWVGDLVQITLNLTGTTGGGEMASFSGTFTIPAMVASPYTGLPQVYCEPNPDAA